MVKISVIITTYNAAKSIARTLNSVLAQDGLGTDFTMEIIAVDDCSTDNTTDILQKFNVTIYYTSSKNKGGPNYGRNIGLKNATGDYICFLDHDDTWQPQKLLLQLKAVRYASIVTCGYEVIDSPAGTHLMLTDREPAVQLYKPNETFLKKLAKEKQNVQHTYLSSIMITKELKDIFFEEHFGMLDFDWLLRLFENRTSAEVPINLVTRFVDGSNLSLNHDYRKKDYYYSLMCLEAFEKKYPKEVAQATRRINGSRARYSYLVGEMREARKYLLKAMPGLKELLYYITSFYGSKWVKKRFIIFG
ncbi:MAG TPA: glycosyltransferase family 2 protein [Ohtaekwangia sp.]|uniref:glycosyltransferase family 2 protein n=1 Tax=Ohtaekwangia sp. TaxID=2066019 RepID=UPI002F94F23C